jgi:hypothetical protein
LIVNRVNDSGNSLFIKNQEKACTRVEWVCDVCVSILAGKQLIDLLLFPYDTHTQSLVSCIISARVKRISVLAEIDLKIPPDGELEGI